MKAPVMYEFLRWEGGEGGVGEGRLAAAEVRDGSKSYSTMARGHGYHIIVRFTLTSAVAVALSVVGPIKTLYQLGAHYL